jgi:hypothetical protein
MMLDSEAWIMYFEDDLQMRFLVPGPVRKITLKIRWWTGFIQTIHFSCMGYVVAPGTIGFMKVRLNSRRKACSNSPKSPHKRNSAKSTFTSHHYFVLSYVDLSGFTGLSWPMDQHGKTLEGLQLFRPVMDSPPFTELVC